MFRLLKAFLHDGVSWALAVFLLITIAIGLTNLFNRYDRVDQYKKNLLFLEYDIVTLESSVEEKKLWLNRLNEDPMAWEQVAREKMNYLGPDEVLVTFTAKE